jgi:hypothetical protein
MNNRVTTNGGYGISIWSAGANTTLTNITLARNIVTTNGSNAYGILFSSASNSSITNNTISTAGSDAFGALLYSGSNNNTFTNNNITTAGHRASGIFLVNGSNNTFIGNALRATGASSPDFVSSDAVIRTTKQPYIFRIVHGGGKLFASVLRLNGSFDDPFRGADLYGAFINSNGSAISEFPISVTHADEVGIAAHQNSTGNFLVAWEDVNATNTSIRSRFVSPSGTLLGSESIAYVGLSGSGISSITSNGSDFLVAYQSSIDNNTYVMRINPSGQFLPPIPINATAIANTNTEPRIAFDGTNYLVIWADKRSGDKDIYGRFVNTSGTPLGPVFPIVVRPSCQKDISIVFGGGKYLVTWSDGERLGTGYGEDVKGQFILPSGDLDGPSFMIDQNDFPSDNPTSIATNRTDFIVCFHDEVGGEMSLYGRPVSSAGAVGSRFKIANSSGNHYFPTGAWNGSAYIITWVNSAFTPNAVLRQRAVHADGTPIGNATTIATPSETGDILAVYPSSNNKIVDMLFNSTSYPTAASFIYNGSVNVSSTTAPSDSGFHNVGKYLNVSGAAGTWVFLNISYSNHSYDSTLSMYRWTGSAWQLVTDTGTNGINTASGYVYANITSFSVFAPMANATSPPHPCTGSCGCTPSYSCPDWPTCTGTETQTRTCQDTSGCNAPSNEETRQCEHFSSASSVMKQLICTNLAATSGFCGLMLDAISSGFENLRLDLASQFPLGLLRSQDIVVSSVDNVIAYIFDFTTRQVTIPELPPSSNKEFTVGMQSTITSNLSVTENIVTVKIHNPSSAVMIDKFVIDLPPYAVNKGIISVRYSMPNGSYIIIPANKYRIKDGKLVINMTLEVQ